MFEGKPIVINGGVGIGKLLASIMPREIEPLQPHLPYSRKQPRSWGPTVVSFFVFPILFVLTGLFVLELGSTLGIPVVLPAIVTFLLVSLGIYTLLHSNIYDLLNLTETELIITGKYVERHSRRPLLADEVRRIPLSEYLGLRFEVHEVTRNHPNRYTHEVYFVTLVHPDSQQTLNLYHGQTSQHIPYVLNEWSKLLPVPVLEPNELAKERIAIVANAERNRGKLLFQS